MMRKLILVLGLVGSGMAQACPKSSSISGYDDLVRSYAKNKHEDVAKRYAALCSKKKGKFECSSEVVAEVRADERMKELIGNDTCKDGFKIPDSPGMVKLLFLKPI